MPRNRGTPSITARSTEEKAGIPIMPPIRKVIIKAGLTLLQKEINICPSLTEISFFFTRSADSLLPMGYPHKKPRRIIYPHSSDNPNTCFVTGERKRHKNRKLPFSVKNAEIII